MKKIKTFFHIIKWIVVTLLVWFWRATPKSVKDISIFLNLIVTNYIIFTVAFLPPAQAYVQENFKVLPNVIKVQVEKYVTVEKEIEDEQQLKIEEYIKIAKEKGFTKQEEIKWLLGKLNGESRWGTSKLYYQNQDGTLDRGECMLNSYWYSWVSDQCAWDTECCVGVMIDEYRKGNGNNWLASDAL